MTSLTFSRRPRLGREWLERSLRVAAFLGVIVAAVAGVRLAGALNRANAPAQAPRSSEERVMEDAKEAVRQDPNNVTARWQLSLALSSVGDYQEALSHAEQAARLGGQTTEPFYALGIAYKGLGDNQRAIKAFTKAAAITGSVSDIYREVYYELGDTYVRVKRYRDAVNAFQAALGNGPEATYVVLALADSYRKVGDKWSAIREYLAVMGYDPTNDVAEKALLELGVSRKAIDDARNPVAHRPLPGAATPRSGK